MCEQSHGQPDSPEVDGAAPLYLSSSEKAGKMLSGGAVQYAAERLDFIRFFLGLLQRMCILHRNHRKK